MSEVIASKMRSGLELARFFHETYERLAPTFGYETRPDTKDFSPSSRNGQLMTAVCTEVLNVLQHCETRADGQVSADTGHVEADRIIARLASSDPDFDDCTDAAVLIRRLVADARGPDGYATWRDAAVAERLRRVEVEKALGDRLEVVSRIPPPNPQLQAHISAVGDFMEELGPYLGLEDGLVATDEFIKAAKRIRQWCSDHQTPIDFARALKIAEGVFERYHKDQPKWWRRMDGTPILNDVAVRMAEAFRNEATMPMRSPAETTAPLRAVPDNHIAKALTELVRLKDIKERWEMYPAGVIPRAQWDEYDEAQNAYVNDYQKNRDDAWEAARSALKATGDADGR